MSILSKITSFVGGDLFKGVADIAMKYYPPDMSEGDKAKAKLAIENQLHIHQMEAMNILNESAKALDKRIEEQEGTAKDLKGLPYLGPVILFLRGTQRPVWGYATLAMDMMWLFGETAREFSEKQELALVVINILVLGFLFGERAIQNVLPIIERVFFAKK